LGLRGSICIRWLKLVCPLSPDLLHTRWVSPASSQARDRSAPGEKDITADIDGKEEKRDRFCLFELLWYRGRGCGTGPQRGRPKAGGGVAACSEAGAGPVSTSGSCDPWRLALTSVVCGWFEEPACVCFRLLFFCARRRAANRARVPARPFPLRAASCCPRCSRGSRLRDPWPSLAAAPGAFHTTVARMG